MNRSPVLVTVLLCALLVGMGLRLWACGNPTVEESSATVPTSTESAVFLTSDKHRLEPSSKAQAQIPTLVASNTTFALNLRTASRETDDTAGANLVLSPCSLSIALAMTYAGARDETEGQMAEAPRKRSLLISHILGGAGHMTGRESFGELAEKGGVGTPEHQVVGLA